MFNPEHMGWKAYLYEILFGIGMIPIIILQFVFAQLNVYVSGPVGLLTILGVISGVFLLIGSFILLI